MSAKMLPTLPTVEACDAAEDALQTAHEEAEAVAWGFTRFALCYEHERIVPEVLPTEADVGRFYLLAHYLDLRSAELHNLAESIVDALPVLGEMPTNVKLFEGRRVA